MIKKVQTTIVQVWFDFFLKNKRKISKIAFKIKRRMLPETQCNEALVVKGATDFSIAAIMGRQSVCMDSPDKSSSKFLKWIFNEKKNYSFLVRCSLLLSFSNEFVVCLIDFVNKKNKLFHIILLSDGMASSVISCTQQQSIQHDPGLCVMFVTSW